MKFWFPLFLLVSVFSCNTPEKTDSASEKKEISSENHPSVKTDWAHFNLKGKVKSLHVSYYFAKTENDTYVIGEKMDEEENFYHFDSNGYMLEHYVLKGMDTISHAKYKHDNYGRVLEMETNSRVYHLVTKHVSTYMKDNNKITELKYYKNDTLQSITATSWDPIDGGWIRRDLKKDADGNTISEWEIEILEDGKGNVTEQKEKLMGRTLKHEQFEYDSGSRLIRYATLAGMATVEYIYQYDSLGLNTEIVLTDSNGANKQITKITYDFGKDSLNWSHCFRNTDNKTGYYEKREITYY